MRLRQEKQPDTQEGNAQFAEVEKLILDLLQALNLRHFGPMSSRSINTLNNIFLQSFEPLSCGLASRLSCKSRDMCTSSLRFSHSKISILLLSISSHSVIHPEDNFAVSSLSKSVSRPAMMGVCGSTFCLCSCGLSISYPVSTTQTCRTVLRRLTQLPAILLLWWAGNGAFGAPAAPERLLVGHIRPDKLAAPSCVA